MVVSNRQETIEFDDTPQTVDVGPGKQESKKELVMHLES